MSKNIAYLGLGANLGDAVEQLACAVHAIAALPGTTVEAASPYYITAPVGYLDQPDFTNQCVRVATGLSPEALLGACLGIEAALGRERSFKNAPRVIDIDVLLYEGQKRETEELQLPHPRLFERAFALIPLTDILLNNSEYMDIINNIALNIDKNGIKKL